MSQTLTHSHSLSEWISNLTLIFAVIDPFGYIPIFLSMTEGNTDLERRAMLKRACVTAWTVLVLFTFLGNSILGFFGITIPSLQISGGLILLIISFEMLKVLPVVEKLSMSEQKEGVKKEDISIIPLAIPMLAGPASMTTLAVLASKAQVAIDYGEIVVSITVTLGVTYLVLRSAGKILKWVGLTGLRVITRIMGFLLCAMAVQYVINGYLAIR